MYQFNVGLVIDEFSGMCILRCSSASPIDTKEVQRVASTYIRYAKATRTSAVYVMSAVRDAIQHYCGVDVELISSDIVITISSK